MYSAVLPSETLSRLFCSEHPTIELALLDSSFVHGSLHLVGRKPFQSSAEDSTPGSVPIPLRFDEGLVGGRMESDEGQDSLSGELLWIFLFLGVVHFDAIPPFPEQEVEETNTVDREDRNQHRKSA